MDWMIDGGRALGIGLMIGGYMVISDRRKQRKRAAVGDEEAMAKLEKHKTVETVVAPLILGAGVCLTIASTYADYVQLRAPLSPEKAFERAAAAQERAIKRLLKSE
jgi:hypothetical protein